MSMSMRTLLSSSAKFIGTWMAGWPDLSRARISALALNALTSPNNLVIAAFQPGGPPAGIWAWAIAAAPEARLAARASQAVFMQFISEYQNFRRSIWRRVDSTKRNCLFLRVHWTMNLPGRL